MKGCSISLVIEKMQIKAMQRTKCWPTLLSFMAPLMCGKMNPVYDDKRPMSDCPRLK
jgi:hypothetical protein